MNKIIFLDFDGVLNHACYLHALYARRKREVGYLHRDEEELEPVAVKLMSNFADEINASVVISSSWRLLIPLPTLIELLQKRGWENAPIIDITPRTSRGFRGDEVNLWLSEHSEVENHVIFDDDGDFHMDQPLVQTDWNAGLLPEHIEQARKYFDEKRST